MTIDLLAALCFAGLGAAGLYIICELRKLRQRSMRLRPQMGRGYSTRVRSAKGEVEDIVREAHRLMHNEARKYRRQKLDQAFSENEIYDPMRDVD